MYHDHDRQTAESEFHEPSIWYVLVGIDGCLCRIGDKTLAPEKQNNLKYFIYTTGIIIIALSFLLIPVSVRADGGIESYSPDFSRFVESVTDGKAGILKGVYVPDVLSFPVTQQPIGNPGYVSQDADVVTQFSMAAEAGNVGLLAHNHLAGQTFTDLTVGDEVRLVYGDGKIEHFVVTELLEYQALQPYSPYSEFRDLETSQTISATDLFRKVYRGDRHVTFQVCIAANGIDAWGRLFVIAQPKTKSVVEQQYLLLNAAYWLNH